ncbi:MAG: hypothetical protein E7463_09110 [Ruminococcaceae bacterium]|nr:hypothetical protein [Oscillospiraceae bacterium]
MTDIIFSFDTEDFTWERAADGIYDIAELLRSEGIRGCFNMVGLLAEQLISWGRTDVLEALKYHEVEFHSYGHSLHPCINEYTNIEDFQAAYNEIVRREAPGIGAVKAATGVNNVLAACPPGNNENYIAMYAYADMGINCYCGCLIDSAKTKGVYFCNQLYSYYYDGLEALVPDGRHLDDAYYDQLASRAMVNIYNHPNRLLYRTFWDAHNYYDGVNHHPFGQWEEAEPYTPEERKALLEGVRTFVRRLKADGRFRFRTFGELVAERNDHARILKPEDMSWVREQLRERFYPIEKPESLCISDIFAACVKFLRGDKLAAAGRVHGFLETPYAIAEPVTVKAEDVRKAAAGIDLYGFLPTEIEVGGTKVGPADFLYAMLDTLAGEEEIDLEPREQNIDLREFPGVEKPMVDGWMFSKEFKAEWLKYRTPLQAWTLRV